MTPEEENEKYTKPCRVDGVTPCVQLPCDDDDDDCCGCDDYCDECEVAITYRNKNKCNLKEGKNERI